MTRPLAALCLAGCLLAMAAVPYLPRHVSGVAPLMELWGR